VDYLSTRDLMLKLEEAGLSYSAESGGRHVESDIFISKNIIGTTSAFYKDGVNIPFIDGTSFIDTLMSTENELSVKLFA
jgi:hypothetical protein